MAAHPKLPPELLSFALHSASTSDPSPRTGTLSFPNRTPISTPHYIALTSRGVVPHITQDTMRHSISITGIYAALEDFIEKAPQATPPVYNFPASSHESPLRGFIALQQDALLVLGPRRIPPVVCPASNTHTAISTCTSVGFRMLESEDYVKAVQKLRPDIALGLADVVYGPKPGIKRVEKMGDRTLAWLKELADGLNDEEVEKARTALFAPILPIEKELQSHYLEQLQEDELQKNVNGLVLHDPSSISVIPPPMRPLPRLSLTSPANPHTLLSEISLGIDIFTLPFISAATDAGIALDFSFPAPKSPSDNNHSPPLPLGINMWSPSHSTSLSPLHENCTCYTCSNHHRAYIQHLLSAKEMLGWVLLQIHNHSTMDTFFAGVRASIARGGFEAERVRFGTVYEAEMPEKTGLGPRVRGYQFKSSGPGEAKKNPSAYRSLDDAVEKLAEAEAEGEGSVLGKGAGAGAGELEERGFAKKIEEAEGEER